MLGSTGGSSCRSPASTFRDKHSETARRQKTLTLELSRSIDPVPKAHLGQMSPKLAAMYRRKTDKTLTRDLNALIAMGLVVQRRSGYVANTDVVKAFLPARNHVEEP